MNKKMSIILIAIIGIGLYALPSTVALFSGQHDFVNIDATGNQIECTKCHGDVQAELGANTDRGTIASASQKPHSGFKCEYCHRIEAGAASGDNAYAIVTYAGGSPTVRRTIAMTIENFEDENFPGSPKFPGVGILNINDINADGVTTLSEATSGFVFMGKTAISPPTVGQETQAATLTLSNEYIMPTMSVAGVPIDTSANKYDGLNLASTTMGWTSGSRYWTPNLVGAGSRAVNPGTEYHAASLVSCLECHGGFEPLGHYSRVLDAEDTTISGGSNNKCYDCHYGYDNRITTLAAGGFGITGGADTGAQEAHAEYQTTDDLITEYKTVGSASYSNGACINCHTHTSVDITYQKPDTMQFAVNFNSDGSESPGGFSATGAVTSCSDGGAAPCND